MEKVTVNYCYRFVVSLNGYPLHVSATVIGYCYTRICFTYLALDRSVAAKGAFFISTDYKAICFIWNFNSIYSVDSQTATFLHTTKPVMINPMPCPRNDVGERAVDIPPSR